MSTVLNSSVLRAVSKEILSLKSKPCEGIRVEVNESDFSDIRAVISGPEGTPYERGDFLIKLLLSADFPTVPPKGYFITKVFHPNISQAGEICVNTLKRDWQSSHGLRHVLQVIRCLLIVPFPESALNEDASKMFLENYEEYCERAKLLTKIHAMKNKKPSKINSVIIPEVEGKENIENSATEGIQGQVSKGKRTISLNSRKKRSNKSKNLRRL